MNLAWRFRAWLCSLAMPDRLDVTLRFGKEELELLKDIRRGLRRLEEQGALLMALNQETLDVLKKVDDATTAVGARITDLITQIEQGSVADQAEVVARLRPIAETLTAMASNPENPFPG